NPPFSPSYVECRRIGTRHLSFLRRRRGSIERQGEAGFLAVGALFWNRVLACGGVEGLEAGGEGLFDIGGARGDEALNALGFLAQDCAVDAVLCGTCDILSFALVGAQ